MPDEVKKEVPPAEVKPKAPQVEDEPDAVEAALGKKKEEPQPKVAKAKEMPKTSGGQIAREDVQVHVGFEPPAPGPILTCPKCGNLTNRVGKQAKCSNESCDFSAVEG